MEAKYEEEPLNVNTPEALDTVPSKSLLKYSLSGRPAFTSVTVYLDGPDDKVKADSGAMIWMDASTAVSTSCDGCCNACLRQCAGEGGCFNTFSGPGNVTLAIIEPGDILPFIVTPKSPWILGARAFVGGTSNIKVSCQCGTPCGCCLGEDLFLTHISTDSEPGMFFAGGYGQIIKHDIPSGQSLYVNNSLFFAAKANIPWRVSILGGCKTCFFGKEGFVMRFDGPNIVYTQSRDPRVMDSLVFNFQTAKQRRSSHHSAGV